MKKESMQIVFGGQSHQIDSNTLINTLTYYNSVISVVNSELSNGARQINININALKEGSFIIDVSLAESIKTIFSSDTISYLSGVVTVTGGVFAAYKKFKGKPVKNHSDLKDIPVNNKQINIDHNTIIQHITNVYNSRGVREAISKSIETANNDVNVENITLSGNKMEPVEFSKHEFVDYMYIDFDMEENRHNEIDEYVDANLVVIGLSFSAGGRWNFMYNGFPIGMIVKDDALMREIDNGARFGKGDAIKVKMKIVKRYNPTYNAYENKLYRIVEFYEHIVYPKPTQSKLL